MIDLEPRGTRRPTWKGPVAALLAATVLVGSVAPSMAFRGAYTPHHERQGYAGHSASFHRHFSRGVRAPVTAGVGLGLGALGVAGLASGMNAVAADPAEEEIAYCADRFRSYDPSTGSYLGYDGDEHACP